MEKEYGKKVVLSEETGDITHSEFKGILTRKMRKWLADIPVDETSFRQDLYYLDKESGFAYQGWMLLAYDKLSTNVEGVEKKEETEETEKKEVKDESQIIRDLVKKKLGWTGFVLLGINSESGKFFHFYESLTTAELCLLSKVLDKLSNLHIKTT